MSGIRLGCLSGLTIGRNSPTFFSGAPLVASAQAHPRAKTFTDLFLALGNNVSRVIKGKSEVIELLLLSLVSNGHVLLEDVPGVGKTSLAKALARSIDCSFNRVQFTPDLLPTDVVGVTIWDRGESRFDFRPGPVFANIVLADEINRASPKTQSALLEAMAEEQVTVDGTTHPLNKPFMVIATQNPLDHEGTFPLPESQLDRFLMRVSMGYPGRDAELAILAGETDEASRHAVDHLEPVLSGNDLVAMGAAAATVHVSDGIREYLVDLADNSRRHPSLAMGMSPRATLSLQRVARARAAAAGRDFVLPDDIKALAPHVLAHRMPLRAEAAMANTDPRAVVGEIINATRVPTAGNG